MKGDETSNHPRRYSLRQSIDIDRSIWKAFESQCREYTQFFRDCYWHHTGDANTMSTLESVLLAENCTC